jgi:hypothetical protein
MLIPEKPAISTNAVDNIVEKTDASPVERRQSSGFDALPIK